MLPSNLSKIRILLADDHRLVREGRAPFAVRRNDGSQQIDVAGVHAEARRVGVSERPRNVESDVSCAPLIGEPDVEQVRTQRELENDADLIELVVRMPRGAALHAKEEALGVVIPKPAVAASFPAPPQDQW